MSILYQHASRRNPLPLPPIQHEEFYYKPISLKGCLPGWEDTVCTNCRLNMHHTLASIRKDCHLKGPLQPCHSLDLAISGIYQHGPEDFADKSDVIRQPETAGYPTWRLLKNKRHNPWAIPKNLPGFTKGEKRTPFQFRESPEKRLARSLAGPKVKDPRIVDQSHPLKFGGLTERRNPFNVKLGISSHHSPQSNNGFSRNSYGAFYTA